MNEFFGIIWVAPENWWFFPVIIFVIVLLVYAFVKRVNIIALLADPQWRSHLLRHYSTSRGFIKVMLMSAALMLLFLALLRPSWHKKEEVVEQEGREILIALDVSRSMLAQDYKPNRLEFSKKKIRALLSALSSERVGLLLFSGTAFVQCPLTSDYTAFYMFLNQVDAESIASGTTALDQALQKSIELLSATPSRKNKLLVVLTDGEDFSSNLSAVKQQAHDIGLTIFTLGVAMPEGAPIPLLNRRGETVGHQKDEQGAVVISRLNEGILRNLALDAGGTYIQATADESDIHLIAQKVQQFEKERFEDKKVAQLEEQYHYFVGAALICLLLEWIL
jgi:Ca-activated chloride channel family protein